MSAHSDHMKTDNYRQDYAASGCQLESAHFCVFLPMILFFSAGHIEYLLGY